MMTVRQILANVPRDRLLLARDIGYKFAKGDPVPGVRIVRAKVRSPLKSDGTPKPGKGDTYEVYVKALDKTKLLSKGPVEVSCTCADFWSHWEVALHKQGAAQVLYSNGKKPNITNPQMTPGACIAEGELVTTDQGSVPIEHIKVHDKVLTLAGYKDVTNFSYMGIKSTLCLTTSSAKSLVCTPDHRVYAIVQGDIRARWVEASELKVGDCLISLRPKAATKKIKYSELNPRVVVLGILIAELGETGYSPVTPTAFSEVEHWSNKAGLSVTLDKNHLEICSDTSNWCSIYGVLGNSSEQRLPSRIWTASYVDQISMLYGLFTGDGWISELGNAATYGTSSRTLSTDVQRLLYMLGIHSTVSTEYTGDNNTLMYLVRPSTSGVQRLIEVMPHLRKYNYRPKVYAAVSAVENSLPIHVNALRLELLSMWINRLVSGGGDRTEVRINDLVGDRVKSATQWIESTVPGSVRKIKIGTASKPQSFAPVALIQAFLMTVGSRQFNLRTNSEYDNGPFKGRSAFLAWLSDLPRDIFKDVHDHFNDLCKETVTHEKIINIVNSGPRKVYDIEVTGPEHFTASGFIVHNCKHLAGLLKLLADYKI